MAAIIVIWFKESTAAVDGSAEAITYSVRLKTVLAAAIRLQRFSSSASALSGTQMMRPWIAMVTLVGVKGARLVLSEHEYSPPAWQDPAYLGEIIDDRLDEESLKPLIDGFWRVFGVDWDEP